MRISSALLGLVIFVAAGLLCFGAAKIAVGTLEHRSVVAVYEALLDNDHDWPSVQGDGLQIILEGEAPSEAARFRAMSIAGTMVDSSRVIDNMTVAESVINTAPDFAIEFLRNDSGVSMIGLIPASTDREDVAKLIGRFTEGVKVTDLLNSADYEAPELWSDSLNFTLRALRLLPKSKISMTAERVDIRAISASEDERAGWQHELNRLAPDGVKVTTEITAPRPVITPFTVRFVKDGDGARFDACSADTEMSQRKIQEAALAAGVVDGGACDLGLGVPSKTWADAVTQSIAAVDELGGGTLTIADADVSLVALEGTEQATFDAVIGQLQNNLPEVFSLEAELPLPPDPDAAGPPEFVATLSPEGLANLRGRVADDLMNTTAENYAKARFGKDNVRMGTRILGDGLPAGWSVRVLTGIEALSFLQNGSVVVQPGSFIVKGRSGTKTARADISRLLIKKIGEGAPFSVDVTYDEALDPIAALPTPEECLKKIVTANSKTKITFEPGSSRIAAGTLATIETIAEVLRGCPDMPLQISGYTDSQGGDDMNKRLSQQRADAVVDALRLRRVPTRGFTATGFGEADPIADNGTAEGREANRRIEFSLATDTKETDAPATDTPTEEPSNEQN